MNPHGTYSIYDDSTLSVYADVCLHELELETEPAFFLAGLYRKEGCSFAEKLKGEFAIVLHDKKAEEVFFIRDRFGFKPLFYKEWNGTLEFGDKALHLLSEDERIVNREKVRRYLTRMEAYEPYEESTFFEGIFSALPGHITSWTPSTKKAQTFWKLNPSAYRGLGKDKQVEYFRSRFLQSVKNWLKTAEKPGGHLSGGLDSSSVVCAAASFGSVLNTYHVDPGHDSSDEHFFIEAVVQKIGNRHQDLRPESDILDSLKALAHFANGPELYPIPSAFHFAAAQAARADAVDLVLTGHDGDTVTGYGNGLFEQLYAQENWVKLKTVLEQYAAERDLSHMSSRWDQLSLDERKRLSISYFCLSKIKQTFRERAWFKALKRAQIFRKYLGFSFAYALTALSNFAFSKKTPSVRSFYKETPTPDFMAKESLNASAMYADVLPEHMLQFRAITNGAYVEVIEQLYCIGQHFGHRYGFPFFDAALIELSLAIPDEVKFGNGKGRETIREALKEELPRAILDRGTKANFSEYTFESFRLLYSQTKALFSEGHLLWQYADKDKFDKACATIMASDFGHKDQPGLVVLAIRVLFLGIWMEELFVKK